MIWPKTSFWALFWPFLGIKSYSSKIGLRQNGKEKAEMSIRNIDGHDKNILRNFYKITVFRNLFVEGQQMINIIDWQWTGRC